MVMGRAAEKDLYSILGVSPSATSDEIRAAYLSRARVIHPDRFDPERQPQEWRKANEMLAELNEAYTILSNPSSRAEYDARRAKREQEDRSQRRAGAHERPGNQPLEAFEVGELTAGKAYFYNLPGSIQARLLKRQENKGEDQLQIKLYSIFWKFVAVVFLLCWFWYLSADAKGMAWNGGKIGWYQVITLIVALLIGRNCVAILRWMKSSLKPYFYLTPLYFLKTEYDVLSFWPIWTLKGVSITHNYSNGFYQSSDVLLDFDDSSVCLRFYSRKKIDKLLERLRTYDSRLRAAYMNSDYDYFIKNDDFRGVPRSAGPTRVSLPWWVRAIVYLASIFFCEMGLFLAFGTNYDLHPEAFKDQTEQGIAPEDSQEAMKLRRQRMEQQRKEKIAQVLPYSGEVRTWTSAVRVAPFKIQVPEGRHYLVKLVNAYNGAPVMTVFVRSGTTAEVQVPLGNYEVRFASGTTWYGYESLFGPETLYSKADETFSFQRAGNTITG
jgi:DnaJ-domain-containing protein 1